MEYNQSKEEKEVIITQAGNSGGTTTTTPGTTFTMWEIGVFLVGLLLIIIIGRFVWIKCNKRMEKKIRREITRSQELMELNVRRD